MSQGKLIVIESGTDGSGKATQSQLLVEKLKKKKFNVKKIEFPNYQSKASLPLQMYLNGEFGQDPEGVNAFVASTFFAIDRYASYILDWKEFYNAGGIIVADRYTTSNMVHQGSKIADEIERNEFLNWLIDLEYQKIGLPEPDLVVFLNVDPKISLELIEKRDEDKDIHENNKKHLLEAYKTACSIAVEQGWVRVDCIKDGKLKSIEDISRSILVHVENIL